MRRRLQTPAPRGAARRYPPLGVVVDADGVRAHVLERGPRDAPPVVLIHGASGNVRDFAFTFMNALEDRYRVIAVDRPGFGHSERGPADAHRPDVQARIMRRALAQIGVERAILVGHSLGAASALSWALDAPDSALGVVSVSGASHPWSAGVELRYRAGDAPLIGALLAQAARLLINERIVRAKLARIFAPQPAPSGYAEFVGIGLALRPRTRRANSEDVARLKPFLAAQAPRYRRLETPIEIVHGAEDEIVEAAEHAEPLAAEAPEARLTLLPGVGHMPHHVAPEAVTAAIDRVAARSGVA